MGHISQFGNCENDFIQFSQKVKKKQFFKSPKVSVEQFLTVRTADLKLDQL